MTRLRFFAKARACWRVLPLIAVFAAGALCQCRAVVPAGDCQTLVELAKFTIPPPEISDTVLENIGFTADKRPAGWNQLAPLRKYETAYFAAEQGTQNGGTLMIQDATGYLSRFYRSITQTTGYAGRSASEKQGRPIAFGKAFFPIYSLNDKSVENVLKLLVDYSSNGGGLYGILMDGFGLSEVEASACVEEAASQSDAFALGLARVPAEERYPRLSKVIQTLHARYPLTVPYIREFDAFRPHAAQPALTQSAEMKLRELKLKEDRTLTDEIKEVFVKGLQKRPFHLP